jgi:hypothetical protein
MARPAEGTVRRGVARRYLSNWSRQSLTLSPWRAVSLRSTENVSNGVQVSRFRGGRGADGKWWRRGEEVRARGGAGFSCLFIQFPVVFPMLEQLQTLCKWTWHLSKCIKLQKNLSNRYAFGLCILHSYAFRGRNLAYMPKESGYANRDHGILGSTSRAFFFPSRGFPSRRHHFAR